MPHMMIWGLNLNEAALSGETGKGPPPSGYAILTGVTEVFRDGWS